VATRAHYRAPKPGHGAQALHADYTPGTYAPPYQVATVIIPLVNFTNVNGATRVIAGSHRRPFAVSKESGKPHPDETIICADAGSAIVFNGHLLHSGTRNNSSELREALQITYARSGALIFY
ncbi:MAG: phytanoyl-CoA dioxygenase family protein, partial [Candidatus Eremiobacteraeota bacterium]|nr:phytanoyl-CoA dioxygenase family protein [Candidatus Eremiobacteraeota bacterium]